MSVTRLFKLLDSPVTMLVILTIFLLQSLWVAIFFNFPLAYDERYHFAITQIFTNQLSPLVIEQPPEYDYLRDLRHETSFIFHYLLSFPLRFIEIFSDIEVVAIVALRILNICFAVIGLYGFWRLLTRIGISSRYVTTGLFIYTMLPITTLLAATINYDNLLFAVTPFFFLACVSVIDGKKIRPRAVLGGMILGTFACLVKYTFIPLFAATVLYFAYRMLRLKIRIPKQDMWTTVRSGGLWLVGAVITLATLTFLFGAIYGKNIIDYQSISPRCEETLSRERCLASPIVRRTIEAYATKDNREPVRIADYVNLWFNNMWKGLTVSAGGRFDSTTYAPPVFYNAVFLGALVSLPLALYGWSRLRTREDVNYLAFASVVTIFAVFAFNYKSYYSYYLAYAHQPRYLLIVAPILITFMVLGSASILAKYRSVKFISLLLILVIVSQGGGLLTHILLSKDSSVRQNQELKRLNADVRSGLRPLVLEK